MARLWLALGALAGLLAVAMAAWASHGLPQRLDPARLAMVQSAVTMQGWHALALLATALLAERRGGNGLGGLRGAGPVHAAGACFALGLIAFCGAVYSAGLAGVSLGAVAPTGGVLLMAGWACLLLSALGPPQPPR